MQNVSAVHADVNGIPYEEVTGWLQTKADRGEIPQVTAKLRITALNQLVTILGPEEPRDAEWLLGNIEDLGRRWATKTQGNPETARTYAGRARSALSDYIAWKRDPLKFRFKSKEASPERARKSKEKPKAGSAPVEAAAQSPVSLAAGGATVSTAQTLKSPGAMMGTAGGFSEARRTFPLGPNREPFPFELPSDGLTVHDVKRIACHLLTLASDFDPSMPSHAQIFAIINQRGE
ncbi:hypothetical protein [Sorangium sp. So ce1153]|uniref:hypothetical protein n=1 Tax=Sorangium sp. So ce1153 TaxID=3133333 RepID=UPI003F5FE66E